MKKAISVFLVLAMLFTLTVLALPMNKASAESITLIMPTNDGNTDKTSYQLGVGSEDEVTVTANFIPSGYEHRP